MRRLLMLCILICSFVFSAHAQPPVIIKDSSAHQLGKHMAFFVPSHEMTVDEVVQERFTVLQEAVPNLGTFKHSVWLKFELINIGKSNSFYLLIDNPNIEHATLYWQGKDSGTYNTLYVSKEQQLYLRNNNGTDISFHLHHFNKEPRTYYLRIQANQPIIVPISINTANDYFQKVVTKNWLNGIYFGLVLIMAAYNLFLYISIRDRSYLFYVIFICFSGLTQLTLKGIARQYFWPNTPFWEDHGMVLFASISGAAGLLFTRSFLHLKKDYPILNNITLLAVAPFIVSTLLVPINNQWSFLVMRNATTVGVIVTLFISLYVYRKSRELPHLYFLLGWSVLMAGSFVYLLYNFGILPFSLFINYAVQLSSAIEMSILSLALASRINILEKEKEQSRRTSLRLVRENARIIQEQNLKLEEMVKARTEELMQKNEQLNETYENLKHAQSHLVAAEKMSSLGQLTAGIAHEINNPINFVAGNVSPLRRDFNVLIEMLEQVENICTADEPTNAKQTAIAQLKEEIDYDYLKEEINFLLSGIQEGASRTAEIVKGLRTFSRVDEASLKEADLNEGIKSTLVILNNSLSNVSVVVDLRPIPQILCYPGKLNQVFMNIMSNAAAAIAEKFGNQKGGMLTVRTYQEESGKVCVSIADNGIGMDEHTLSKVYEPFFTTKKVGAGVGLGMSIVFSIIKEHHAQIEVKSKLGEGTEFIIKLDSLKDI